MTWNKEMECIDQDSRREKQLENLAKVAETVYSNVPFYKDKFDKAGVKPRDIQELEDIEKLPFTTKDELRQTYPYGLLAVSYTHLTLPTN